MSTTQRCPTCGHFNAKTHILCFSCGSDVSGLKLETLVSLPAAVEVPKADNIEGHSERHANRSEASQQLTLAVSTSPVLDVTLLEDDAAPEFAKTLIEDAPTKPELVDGTARLLAGLEFRGYLLVEPIKVNSAEADLWHATRQSDGLRAVVKVFRKTEQRESAISAPLSKVSLKEVVERYVHGVLEDGRRFEILEFIAHGSLREVITKGPQSEEYVRHVVRELANAIAALHEVNILHRDIKPANVLVRSTNPLDLVLADFGISSLTDVELLVTDFKRTPAYSAPEALTGIVARASDWWSLGVILLELLIGRHPFTGLEDRVINLQLVSRGIVVPDSLQVEWRPLIFGLLTRDYARRWGKEEVFSWLEGKQKLPIFNETGESSKHPLLPAHEPFQFDQCRYDDVLSLSIALARSWEKAVAVMKRRFISEWITKHCANHSLASTLKDIEDDKDLDHEGQLAAALLAMNSSMPLTFRGEVVTAEWFYDHVHPGIRLLASTVPEWLVKLRQDAWLLELREKRSKLLTHLDTSGVRFNAELLDRLIFSSERSVLQQAEDKRAKDYVRSEIASLNSALLKRPLNCADAILILAASVEQFVTRKDALTTVIAKLKPKKPVGRDNRSDIERIEAPAASATYRIRWRGAESEPKQWAAIQKLLKENEIGLMHEICVGTKWMSLRTFLTVGKD